jgi:hypothetical protein
LCILVSLLGLVQQCYEYGRDDLQNFSSLAALQEFISALQRARNLAVLQESDPTAVVQGISTSSTTVVSTNLATALLPPQVPVLVEPYLCFRKGGRITKCGRICQKLCEMTGGPPRAQSCDCEGGAAHAGTSKTVVAGLPASARICCAQRQRWLGGFPTRYGSMGKEHGCASSAVGNHADPCAGARGEGASRVTTRAMASGGCVYGLPNCIVAVNHTLGVAEEVRRRHNLAFPQLRSPVCHCVCQATVEGALSLPLC